MTSPVPDQPILPPPPCCQSSAWLADLLGWGWSEGDRPAGEGVVMGKLASRGRHSTIIDFWQILGRPSWYNDCSDKNCSIH